MAISLPEIIISPNTPGVEADIHLANQLAELGVMFLMFGVGMHFSLNDLLLVRRIACQVQSYKLLLQLYWVLAFQCYGAGALPALVFGLISPSCASTVVLLKALETVAF
ncbi:cation:proton antiporter [Acinetobacter baumannii]